MNTNAIKYNDECAKTSTNINANTDAIKYNDKTGQDHNIPR